MVAQDIGGNKNLSLFQRGFANAQRQKNLCGCQAHPTTLAEDTGEN